MPSAFIALTAGGLCAGIQAARTAQGSSVVSVLGAACSALLALAVCLSLAEMRSTAPFQGGTWHFARMLYGVRGGVLLAWFEILAMVSSAALFLWIAVDLRADLVSADLPALSTLVQAAWPGLLATGGLWLWIVAHPASPRPRSWLWRRLFKWVSYAALTIGWGVAIRLAWEFLLNRITFVRISGIDVLPGDFLRGGFVAFAALLFVVHSVPGDVPLSRGTREAARVEHRRYRLPRGMILGLLTAAVTLVASGLAGGSSSVSGAGEGHAAALAWLRLAAILAALGGTVFALARSVRILSALAREGMLPPWLGRMDPSNPVLDRKPLISAAAVSGGLLLLFLWFAWSDGWRACAASVLLHALLGAGACFCQIRLRREAGDELDYGFVLPGFPWLPMGGGVAMLLLAALCVWVFPLSILVGVSALGSGLLVYEAYARTHSLTRSSDDLQDLFDMGGTGAEESEPISRGTLRILVAAHQEPIATALLQAARRLAAHRPSHLQVLQILTVPDEARISDATRNVSQAVSFGHAVLETFRASGVPVRIITRCARSAARGILITLRETRTDLLLMGWNGRMHRGEPTTWGRTLDPVLRRTPCPVVVAKGLENTQAFRHILVPVTDTEHSAFALVVASRLIEQSEEAHIEIFSVVSHGVAGLDAHAFLHKHARRLEGTSARIVCRTEVYSSIADGILEEVLRGQHDLIVMGASPPEQAHPDEERITTQVAARTRVPCVMVTAASPWKLWKTR